jgi:hypothetical protein
MIRRSRAPAFEETNGSIVTRSLKPRRARESLSREVDVLDAQAHRFHHPHARSVEQRANERVDAVQSLEDAIDFVARQHDGQPDGRLGVVDAIEPRQLDAENFAI